MNLNEYFKKQNCKLCDEKKLLIFDDIKNQITRESIFTKVGFYVKVGVYSFFLLFLFSGLFINFSTNKQVSKNIAVKTVDNKVHANYIAKVIQSNGKFEVYDNNKLLNTNLISNGNVIVLKDNSYIRLAINDGIKTYLLGPAKIQVEKNKDDIYILNIIDGEYLTLKSNSEKDKIIIKSKLLNIESNDKKMDIKYENKNGVSIVENNGGDIVVKNKGKTISLNKKEKLIVLNDKDRKYIENLFSDDYKKYQLNNGSLKVIPSSKDLEKLDKVLDKKYLLLLVGKYVLGKINHNDKLELEGRLSMLSTIVNVYDALNLKVSDKQKIDSSNENLKSLLSELILTLDKKYVLPNVYVQRLRVLLAYIVITEKVKTKKTYVSLYKFVNSLKLDSKYKKILLQF